MAHIKMEINEIEIANIVNKIQGGFYVKYL